MPSFIVTSLINRGSQSFANAVEFDNQTDIMSAARIEQAMTRITAAMERIDTARAQINTKSSEPADNQSSARVMALINEHEKLREEVADTIGELDALIEELEG